MPPETLPHGYSVNVTAIYDTQEGALQANDVLARLNTQIEDDIRFNLQLWRADLLVMPEVYELARKDAAASMLLAVICRGDMDRCHELETLADEWCGERAGTEAALAVLICGGECDAPLVNTLRNMAERNDLDFICSGSPSELHSSLQATDDTPPAGRRHQAHKVR